MDEEEMFPCQYFHDNQCVIATPINIALLKSHFVI